MIINQDHKEKILLAIGSALFLILMALNEVFFVIEYLFKRTKKESGKDYCQKKPIRSKSLAQQSSRNFYSNYSDFTNYQLPSVNPPIKNGLRKPIPTTTYRSVIYIKHKKSF